MAGSANSVPRLNTLRLGAVHTLRDTPAATAVLAAGLGLLVYASVGYFVPGEDYAVLGYGWVLAAVYLVGLGIVGAMGGRARRTMIFVYGAFAIIASLTMVAATWNAARVGTRMPIWLIDRFDGRDDENLFNNYIYPFIGARELDFYPGQTNAPLHWFANVKLQTLLFHITGAPVPWAGLAVNVVVGSMTAAFTAGAIARSLPAGGGHGLAARDLSFLVLCCPWPIAVSVIGIREIWVYCVFAAALYAGVAIRALRPSVRLGALGATIAVLGPACFLLRAEMLGAWLLMLLAAVFTTVDRAEKRFTPQFIRFAILSVVVVVVYTVVSQNELEASVTRRAVQYASGADAAGPQGNEQGMMLALMRQGLAVRGLVGTLWIWFQPLPKVALTPGSLYTAGLVAMPLWTLGCFAMLWLGPRRRTALPEDATSTVRRFAVHGLWIAAFTVSVAFTSCETRHVYAALPLVSVLFANALHASYGPRELAIAKRRSVIAVAAMLAACVLATLLVFGAINI